MRVLFIFVFVIASARIYSQEVSIGFYNVENLFDTLPSPFYHDEFTPHGRKGWDSERFYRKLDNIVRVIDDMSCDVIGLCEVENEEVVRAIVERSKGDYSYIHYTSSDSRGLDVALLYRADIFIPSGSRLLSSSYREPMVVDGMLYGREVSLVVCHMPSKLNNQRVYDRALATISDWYDRYYDPRRSLILMGDLNLNTRGRELRKFVSKRDWCYDLFTNLDNPIGDRFEDIGSYLWSGRWYLYDNILIDRRLSNGAIARCLRSGLFVRPYLFDYDDSGKRILNRSFYSGLYGGGFSDHLPVYLLMEFTGD